jgi:hypothetical protein
MIMHGAMYSIKIMNILTAGGSVVAQFWGGVVAQWWGGVVAQLGEVW